MEILQSKSNPAVKEYVRLRDSRSHRQKTGYYVLESHKLLEEALLSSIAVDAVWMTEQAMEKYADLTAMVQEKGLRMVQISSEIEQKCTLTGNSQGVFAWCRGLDKYEELTKIDHNGRYLYLANLQDTGNVGTMLRTALALGLSGVIVSASTCDLYSIKVIRASMGALFRLPVYWSEDPVRDLKQLSAHLETYAAVVDASAEPIGSFSFAQHSVVVIGNEGNGLTDQEAAACTRRITIPMQGQAESLNASMAAGILMWEQMKP